MLLDGKAPLPGQVVQLPNLGKTFRALAEQGKDGFYKGRIAEEIVALIQSKGGVMELEDLAAHKTDFVEPIIYTLAGEVTLVECPPNGQGLTALMALGILEEMQSQGKIKNLLEMEHNSVEYLHALVEALRLAFADTQHFVADPNVVAVPVEEMLSKAYLAKRAALFDPSSTGKVFHVRRCHLKCRTHPSPSIGKPSPFVGHGLLQWCVDLLCMVQLKSYRPYTVTDQWGNACSYIQSNYAGFGTGGVLYENYPSSIGN